MAAKKAIVMFSVALVSVLLLSVFSLGFQNHVRWNNMLDECVYFYVDGEGHNAHCFVAEDNCEKHGRNTYKDADASTCYYVPRSEQPATCQEFVEGDLIVLDYSGSDPDANIGPAGKLVYTFDKPFDENNKWQTERGDAGEYNVKVTVSDGEFSDDDTVCFRVLPGNKPPVLTVSSISVEEGEIVQLRPTCSDPDGDAINIAYSGAMSSPTWQTTFDDAGEHRVTVTCREVDGKESTSKTVTVTVRDVNRAPILNARDATVREGETVRLAPSCEDPEGQGVAFAYSGKMTTSTWTTGYSDAGVYDVHVTCTDDSGLSSEDTVTVTVVDRNRPPMITALVKRG